ncbi:hypothetical protein SAMN05421739_104347 [Pontibacter chinhatensis]|uniref:Uncharacterized protein n=1 Tax=Pontibacter chinhatensis TaxID=1436961 RepID=A0A1I2VUW7_9BACT|nr:hypothetical protein SAMN05421739_104347 [Pontibacter chinhatensis]
MFPTFAFRLVAVKLSFYGLKREAGVSPALFPQLSSS